MRCIHPKVSSAHERLAISHLSIPRIQAQAHGKMRKLSLNVFQSMSNPGSRDAGVINPSWVIPLPYTVSGETQAIIKRDF